MGFGTTDTKTQEEIDANMEAKNDAKKFKRQMILLVLTMVMVVFVGMPSFYYVYGEKQKSAFLDGKTIWCNNGGMLIKVSQDNGYSYDEKMNAFIDTDAGVAFYNSIDRCTY